MEKYKILNKKNIYSGTIFDLSQHTVELPDGRAVQRDVIVHNGASVIIPVTESKELVLVRQYRIGSDSVMLELPAGKFDSPGEDPEACALRELAEETGYQAKKIKRILKLHPIPAYCTEEVSMFLAEGLTKPGETTLDDEEFLEVELHSLPALLDMIDNGEITDMKTILGVLYYSRLKPL